MKKVVIYGASSTGKRIYEDIKEKYSVVCFVDGYDKIIGTFIDDIIVKSIDDIDTIEYDLIIIGILQGYKNIKEELIMKGISEECIITEYVDLPTRAREAYTKNLSELFEQRKTYGAVAEVGVYQGDFSETISRCFPENTFYLFDTFEGFPESDAEYDCKESFSSARTGYFSNTSVEGVLNRIHNKERCIVRKGYFPETAEGINEKFVFVNLDVDLYIPTKSGLKFFWDKMENGG